MPNRPGLTHRTTHRAFDLLQRRTLLPGPLDTLVAGRGRDLSGVTVVITGASAGIGREAAVALAARGASVIAVARRSHELRTLTNEIDGRFLTCDLSDENSTAELIGRLADTDVDVLVNNAGHSIRRPIAEATDRLHDYQRTIRLNYLAPVQLTLGLLPGMIARDRGQIVNVCTWGLLAGTFPRFSAYAASKSALAIFGRSLAAEAPAPGIHSTNVYFPLVRTGMISPTAEYDDVAALSPQEAADWIVRAVTHQPSAVAPAALRTLLPVLDYLRPTAADRAIAAIT